MLVDEGLYYASKDFCAFTIALGIYVCNRLHLRHDDSYSPNLTVGRADWQGIRSRSVESSGVGRLADRRRRCHAS